MSEYVLGLDGGGTKTVCLAADLQGRVHGRGESGTGNPFLVPPTTLRETIRNAMVAATETLRGAGVNLSAVCLGFAGAGSRDMQELLRTITWDVLCDGLHDGLWKFPKSFSAECIQVVSDPVIALVAGVGTRNGVVAISGTGSIVYGESRERKRAVVGGWGNILSGEGSGYSIGVSALKSILRAEDGRDPPTLLVDSVLVHWGFQKSIELFRSVAGGKIGTVEIAGLVPLVCRAAEQGDATAVRILTKAAGELAEAIITVAKRLDLLGSGFQLVCSGGVLTRCEQVRALLGENLQVSCAQCTMSVLEVDPAVGAVRLAIDKRNRS